MDWSMFVPSMPLLEIVIRGSATFLVLYSLLRLVGRRESASVGMTDVLVIVLVADAASTGMNGSAETLGDGFILVVVILFWSLFIDFLAWRFTWFRRLTRAKPWPLIKNGDYDERTLRREFMTHDEVNTQLRLRGIEDVSQVHRAYLEPNGGISIVTTDEDADAKRTMTEQGRDTQEED